MQTILDQVVKDLIRIWVLNVGMGWIVYVKYVNQSYGHYFSFTSILLNKFLYISFFFQINIVLVIRYVHVFNQTILNYIDETKIIIIIRCFVGVISFTLTINDINDIEERGDYAYLMNQQWTEEKKDLYDDELIVLILNVIITVFVQVRIMLFNLTVTSKSESNQMELGQVDDEGHNVQHKFHCGLSIHIQKFALMLFCLSFFILIDWLLQPRGEEEEYVLSRLRVTVIIYFMMFNLIVYIIRRNAKMHKFCMNQCKYWFFSLLSQLKSLQDLMLVIWCPHILGQEDESPKDGNPGNRSPSNGGGIGDGIAGDGNTGEGNPRELGENAGNGSLSDGGGNHGVGIPGGESSGVENPDDGSPLDFDRNIGVGTPGDGGGIPGDGSAGNVNTGEGNPREFGGNTIVVIPGNGSPGNSEENSGDERAGNGNAGEGNPGNGGENSGDGRTGNGNAGEENSREFGGNSGVGNP